MLRLATILGIFIINTTAQAVLLENSDLIGRIMLVDQKTGETQGLFTSDNLGHASFNGTIAKKTYNCEGQTSFNEGTQSLVAHLNCSGTSSVLSFDFSKLSIDDVGNLLKGSFFDVKINFFQRASSNLGWGTPLFSGTIEGKKL